MILFDNNTEIQYISSGQFQTDSRWIHPKRVCDSNEIIFVQKGVVHIAEEDNRYELHKNDLLILEKNRLHYGYRQSDDVSFFWLHFLYSDFNKLPKNITVDSPLSLVTLFSQALHISNTPGYSQYSKDMICGLLLQEIQILSTPAPAQAKKLAIHIKEWVKNNIDKPITIQDISRQFGYNKDYIGRSFKQAYGITLKRYINDVKLEQAKLLLQTTLYTIKQISYQLGFDNENLFIKFFSYHTKMTPTNYRSIYVNTHTNKK